MSKPLVEPISTASLSPLTWVRKLIIPDSMTGYITEEELKQAQLSFDFSEKNQQKAAKSKLEDSVDLGKDPQEGNEKEAVFSRKTDKREKWLAFSFKDLLKAAILKAYRFDGFSIITNKYITATGEEFEYKDHAFNKLLHIVGFIGFPNRPDNREIVKNKDKLDNETEEKEYTTAFNFPKLSFPQFLLNFLGGWHRDRLIIDENDKLKGIRANKAIKLIQIPASFFKVVIFAVKWVTFPFKFILDVVKSITEVLPTFIADATAQGIGYQVRQIKDLNKSDEESDEENKGIQIAGHVALIFLLGLIYLPFKFTAIVGRTITSPAISAEIAFATGRAFKIDNWPWATTILGLSFGTLGVVLSIGMTIAFWSVGIPLVVGAGMTFAPAVITPIVTWFLQLPLVGTTIGMVHGALVPLSSVIGAAFTPYITAITGLAVGLQIPAEAIALGATLALIVAPSASFLSFAADKLSDYWALAGKYGLIGVFTKYYFPHYFSKNDYSRLNDEDDKPGDGPDKGHGKGTGKDGAPQADGDVPLNLLGANRASATQQGGLPSTKRGSGTLEIFDGGEGDHRPNDEEEDDGVSRTVDAAQLAELTEGLKQELSPRSQTAAALDKKRRGSLGDADDATITAGNAGREATMEPKRIPNPSRLKTGGRGQVPASDVNDNRKGVDNKF